MTNQLKPESSGNNANCVGFFAPRTEKAKKYWNKFCWLCHKEKPAEQTKCDECYHVYHVECLNGDSKCNDCKVAKIRRRILSSDDRNMLKLLVDKLFCNEQFVNFEKQNISKPLTAMKAKLENYTTFAAFLDDIKWTVHKCMVVYSEEHKWVVTVDLLQKYCTDQIDSIQACAECHMNSWESPDQHVTTVCKMVHPIVWALEKSNSLYWPAKCMTVFESKVIVCFFGSHKHIKVDIMECWLYSREPPTRANGEQQRNAEDLLTAMKEADVYIDNLRNTVDDFVYAATDTPFNPIIHFRTNGKEAARSADHQITPVIALNGPELTNSTPVVDTTSRASNHPLISDSMSIIEFNLTNGEQSTTEQHSSEQNSSEQNSSEQSSSEMDSPEKKSSEQNSLNQYSPEPVKVKQLPIPASIGRKRSATETIASESEQKARKTLLPSTNVEVFSSFMKLNFNDYVDKADRLCNGIGQLENRIVELQMDKSRLVDENITQKAEIAKLRAENQQLNGCLSKMKDYFKVKLNEVKRQQWCMTCKRAPMHPLYCSKTCQMAFWKKQDAESEHL